MDTKSCTFFGHRECPNSVQPVLNKVLEHLIIHNGVNMFYVGNQGPFDRYTYHALQNLKKIYPHIDYVVVLAYLLNKRGTNESMCDTLFPEGLEKIHPKYAISWRNRWMLRQSEFVVTYVTHHWGNAAKLAKTAERQGKTVINLFSVVKE